MSEKLRLGVNIDHVATIRNARGGDQPDPVRAAKLAADAGADGVTAHLREDRRHISDNDIERIINEVDLPLNFEIAATDEMLDIALRHIPNAACLVPEKRQELTTEGGLDVVGGHNHLQHYITELAGAGIRVSLFIDPDLKQLEAARALNADIVELHAGSYCDTPPGPERDKQLERIVVAGQKAAELGLECHAGHGLTFDTVGSVAAIESIVELNIGHFLIGEAIFGGLNSTIKRMRALMDKARAENTGSRSA
ncbi:MAG: pyridoxine 5'-phosphate synthase [Alphaproteobacteria bacterium]|jgi:pyridoxine 5-phosphate synthase